jgi:hypothetical protein
MKIRSCPNCLGSGWVCENHPQITWDEDFGCTCGDGKPCECNDSVHPEMRAVVVEEDVTWH